MRNSVVAAAGILAIALLLHGVGATRCAAQSAERASVGTLAVQAVNPPSPPRFGVSSVLGLRAAQQSMLRLQVTAPGDRAVPMIGVTVRAPTSAAGCPDYASGSGVVLRPVQPFHERSSSTLTLHGAFWNERVRRQVVSGDADASFGLWVGREMLPGAVAYFQSLPSALHTYMLTIGTSAPRERVRIRAGDSFIPAANIVSNPATSELRALLTYAAGEHENRLAIYVQYLPSTTLSSDWMYFHHIQLAQLD